jgi:hypothetical protein
MLCMYVCTYIIHIENTKTHYKNTYSYVCAVQGLNPLYVFIKTTSPNQSSLSSIKEKC